MSDADPDGPADESLPRSPRLKSPLKGEVAKLRGAPRSVAAASTSMSLLLVSFRAN